MNQATLVTLSLSSLALCISTCALWMAVRTSGRSLSKRLAELSQRFSEAEETVGMLAEALHRQRTRENMRELRARRKPAENGEAVELGRPQSELEKDRWQREMNLKIATGQVRLGPWR